MTRQYDDEFTPAEGLPDSTVEMVRNLDDGLYQDAEKAKVTPSAILERQDPTTEHAPEWHGTDAFGRAMLALGVRMRDDKVTGEPASTLEDLHKAGGGRGSVLVPEFIMRTLRMANVFGTRIGKMANPWAAYQAHTFGNRFYASSNPVSDVLRPDFLDSYIHAEPLQASILSQMVAVDELVQDAADYQGFYLTYTAAKARLHRITEGAGPPVYELTGSDRTHRMNEYGFELRISDRVAKEWKLPVFQQHMAFIVEQNMLDKEQVAYETVINGDGTAAAASNTNVSALTGGAASTVTYGNLIEWLRLFEGSGNYQPTIGVATSAVCHLLDISTFGSANYPTFGMVNALLGGQGAMPERRTFPPVYARSYATANKLMLWDATKSLRMRYTAQLQETDRVISNRYNKIVISEFTGFSINIDGGRRTLTTNA